MAREWMHPKKAARGLILTLLMLCSLFFSASASSGELVKNGDFSQQSKGWYKTSWIASGGNADVLEESLFIESEQANDVRFRQDLKVAADATYRLTAEVRVESIVREGAAGIWVGFDQTNARMEAVEDLEGWQGLELVFHAAEDGEVSLCLSMGDYGALAAGKAEFRNISLTPVEREGAGDVLELRFAQEEKTEKVDEHKDVNRMLLSRSLSKVFFAIIAGAMVYLLYMWSKRCAWIFPKSYEMVSAIAVLVIALVLRIVIIMMSPGYVNDTTTFAAWGERMSAVGPASFYAEDVFCDYPPGMLYLLWFGSSVARLLGFSQLNTGFGLVALFIPVLLCDMGLVVVVWQYARKRLGNMIGVGLLLILAFQPVFIYDTAVWHQVDAVLGFLLAVTFILLEKEKRLLAAAVFGLAVLMKPQALMFGPVFALPYLKQFLVPGKQIRAVVDILAGIVISLAVIFLASAPFTGNQPFYPFFNLEAVSSGGASFVQGLFEKNWLLNKYFSTTTSYPYATVNAYNIFMLFNGNFVPETTLLGPLTYQQWATIGLFAVLIASVIMYFSAWRRKIDATYLIAAFLIAGLFILGPRMHERYSFPIIVFLILAYAKLKDKALIPMTALFTMGILANMALALLSLNEMDTFFQSSSMWVSRGVALFQVLCFAYLVVVCIDICFGGSIQTDEYGSWRKRRVNPLAGMPLVSTQGEIAISSAVAISSGMRQPLQEDDEANGEEARTAMNPKNKKTERPSNLWQFLRRGMKKTSTGKTVRILKDRFRPRSVKLGWTSFDTVLMLGLTIIYAIIAFFRLGTTDVPQTYWRGNDGQEIVVEFKEPVNVQQVWTYGGISDGSLALFLPSAEMTGFEPIALALENEAVAQGAGIEEGGEELDQEIEVVEDASGDEVKDSADGGQWQSLENIEVSYDVMYRWSVLETNFSADTIRMRCDGSVWLEEMVFVNTDGDIVVPSSIEMIEGEESKDPQSALAHLFDEGSTKPETPNVLNGMYFDELYHGRTAYEHLHGLQPYENTHPPLGKIFIMIGIALFGMNPFGWRCVGTLFGVLMVPIFYTFGKRLLKNSYAALFVSILFTFDFMHFVQTRIATIDVYGVFFILLMYYFMFEYWQMNFYRDGIAKTLRPLALSGLFFGLGAASKWICIYAGGGLAVILFFSLGKRFSEYMMARSASKRNELGARQMVDKTAPFFSHLSVTIILCVIMFVIVPALIYLLSYIPYMLVKEHPYSIEGVLEVQNNMFRYHANLTARHPYESEWWTWPLNIRPIFYYQAKMLPSGQGGVISAFGNPVVWWLGLFSVIALIVRAMNKRRLDNTTIFLLIGLLAQFLPWAMITRATFIYHYFASVPFIILATGYLFIKWAEKWRGAYKVGVVVAGLAVILFFIYYPALSGLPFSREFINALRIFPSWTW